MADSPREKGKIDWKFQPKAEKKAFEEEEVSDDNYSDGFDESSKAKESEKEKPSVTIREPEILPDQTDIDADGALFKREEYARNSTEHLRPEVSPNNNSESE